MKTKQKWMIAVSLGLIASAAAFLYAYRSDRSLPGVRHPLPGQFNAEVPEARNTPRPGWTKLDYYKQADADSAKRKADQARDPYYVLPEMHNRSADAQADALTRQLDALHHELRKPAAPPKKPVPLSVKTERVTPDIRQLEAMVQAMQPKPAHADPEMEQLNGMLDKIMDIQHPERVSERPSSNGPVYTVTFSGEPAVSGFFGLTEDLPVPPSDNAFAAVIADAQTLVSGAVIKMRLTQEMMINGQTIPSDQLVYGLAQLNGERLLVDITQIRLGQLILPVKLSVFDQDGLPGLYIPGAITRDVAKQSAGQSMSQWGLTTFDPSIGAQAAGAGIQAAKTLLQKKVQQVRVTVPVGYAVFLKNN